MLVMKKDNDNITELSDEMIQAYLDAADMDTPDLWSRIEDGFDREYADMQNEGMQTNNTSIQQDGMKQDDDVINVPEIMENTSNIENDNGSMDNVVQFGKYRFRAKKKKYFGIVAAVILVAIIAIPVLKLGSGGRTKSGDTIDNSVKGEFEYSGQDGVDAAASDMMEESEETYYSADMESAENSQGSDGIADSASADESAAANTKDSEAVTTEASNITEYGSGVERQICVSGKFDILIDPTATIVMFEVSKVVSNEYDEYDIKPGDRIVVWNAEYVIWHKEALPESNVVFELVSMRDDGLYEAWVLEWDY